MNGRPEIILEVHPAAPLEVLLREPRRQDVEHEGVLAAELDLPTSCPACGDDGQACEVCKPGSGRMADVLEAHTAGLLAAAWICEGRAKTLLGPLEANEALKCAAAIRQLVGRGDLTELLVGLREEQGGRGVEISGAAAS